MNLESFKSVILYEIQGYRKENGTSDTATVLMFFFNDVFLHFSDLCRCTRVPLVLVLFLPKHLIDL